MRIFALSNERSHKNTLMKLRYLLLAILFAFLQISLYAEHVTVETASKVGKNFMTQKHTYLTTRGESLMMYKSIELTQASNRTVDNQRFYIFNLNDDLGWVIVADDDRCTPILGYSKSGEFVTENLPENIKDWLIGINSEIQYVVDNNVVVDTNTLLQWKELNSGTSTEFINRGEDGVNPLIQTKWNQAPYYNNLCPYDNYYHDRTVTGCVATAMAQVMKYWNHPSLGAGSHSYSTSSYGTLYANFGGTNYDWNNMPTRLTSSSSTTQKNAIATLMYHCGVSVEMSYGVASTGGSGAYVISSYTNGEHCAEYAFKHYFGYKNSASGKMKDNFTDSQWKSMLRAELNSSRPLVYAGFGNGGHCFVCDGYDNNDKFHFNWGWDGQNDGYFSLSALNPGSGGAGGGSYSFTNNQQAIFGLEPNNGGGGGGTNSPDIRLYSSVSVDNEIWFGGEISVSASIGNWGTSTMNGYISAAAFDANGNFLTFIDTKNVSIQGGYYNTYSFATSENMIFVPGHYQLAIFYKTGNGEWTIVDNGDYYNYASFDIIYSATLETRSVFTIKTNNARLIQGLSATVNVDVKNTGNSTFYGQLRVSLSNLDGSFVQTIGTKDLSSGLQPNYHYTNGADFTGVITADPGTYHMELAFKSNGSNSWYYAGASNYANPIIVVVEAQSTNADNYENNNTQSTARLLPLYNWTNHQITVRTTGSNIHVGNDIDYYKIELPNGYHYTIKPRLHDSYNSGNGQNYTVDAMFAYSTDGQNYSSSIDDVMTGNIAFNGGTIYFVVSPYFSGMTGTYLLEIQIEGDGDIGVDEEYAADVFLYPNPVNDVLHLECENMTGYDMYSYDGRLIKSSQTTDNEAVIDFSDFDSGAYLLKIKTIDGTFTRRVIKK